MSSYDIVNAIFNNDAVSLESLFKTTINEKIAEKLNDSKNKLEKKLFKKEDNKSDKKEKQPLDHMQHFNTNGKVSAKDLFVDKNPNNSFLSKFKMKHNIKEGAEEELPLGKFNNLASEDQKHHLKSLLAAGRHMEANGFIKKVLNKEDIT